MGSDPPLTRRERDVLEALCRPVLSGSPFTEPASIREIAAELVVSDAAVKQHLLRLYDKFGIPDDGRRRRVELANAVVRSGVLTTPVAGSTASVEAATRRAREALARRDWEEAWSALSSAAPISSLDPAAAEVLGDAAAWTNRREACVEARQRAFTGYLEAGDREAAARLAIGLVVGHIVLVNLSGAAGWFGRASRLLAAQPESAVHGELAAIAALIDLATGADESALENARRAREIGERHGNADVAALGLVNEGQALARLGRLAESSALLDEAMAAATTGELGELATGLVFCRTICTCLDLFDLKRAGEWIDLARRWSGRIGPPDMGHDCRTHLVAVRIVRGEWSEAAAEAEAASEHVWDRNHAALAVYELGEIRLRTGDLDGAEEAFRRAHEMGAAPHPGLALLRLEQGRAQDAAVALVGALAATSRPLARARLLPAQVEVSAAVGDPDTARAASRELDEISSDFPAPALRALADCARGAVRLLDGDPATALGDLQRGFATWQDIGAPYDAARTRLLMAQAFTALGDAESAEMEVGAARREFSRLGALRDAERPVTADSASQR
jgi:ATP/maltotriose-dependent transcriptional regulator MalT